MRAAAVVLLLHPALAAADFIVPANAIGSINGGTLNLGCTDLIVAGTLQLGGGQVLNVRNVTIQGGGTIDGGSGVIQVSGNWTASGSFTSRTGEVDFRDLCSAGPASISGNTTFFRASFVSMTSKNYTFAVGSTQKILSVLEISGSAPNPIQFESATPGQVAFINPAPIRACDRLCAAGSRRAGAPDAVVAPDQQIHGPAAAAHLVVPRTRW